MSNFSLEELQAVEEILVAENSIRYEDWPYYQWYNATNECISQDQVTALCIARLTTMRTAEKAAGEVAQARDKSKGGRPKLPANEKLKCVSVMVSPSRYEELHVKAVELGLSISELARPMIDPRNPHNRRRLANLHGKGLSVAERKTQRELAGMSADFRQLAKIACAANMPALEAELRELSAKVWAVLKH